MEEHSQLKDSILEQAHEKGRKILAEAKERVQAEAESQEARVIQEKLQQRAEQTKRVQRRLQREKQQIENQKRQSTLVTKQRVLRELFADAYQKMADWSAQEELDFIRGVLGRYEGQELVLTFGQQTADKLSSGEREQLLQTYPRVTLAEETIADQAGFVLSIGKVDDNYLYSSLMDAIWEQESYQFAAAIFGAGD